MPNKKIRTELWQAIQAAAITTGLDPQKFGLAHAHIISIIAEFLATKPPMPRDDYLLTPPSWVAKHLPILARFKDSPPPPPPIKPVSPVIIYGEPGTGKTTFLYILDSILRTHFKLPDNLRPEMRKNGQQTHPLHKRLFNGGEVSLLSVRKWTELLNFYMWDIKRHQLNETDLAEFIRSMLLPMRIVFADEVEMEGYAPTIPVLAKHGILVIGTSNQSEFKQLDDSGIPPRLYFFGGEDMRNGDPTQAVVVESNPAWQLFNRLETQESYTFDQFSYRYMAQAEMVYLLLDFKEAVKAPLLETKWINFLQATYQQAAHHKPFQTQAPFTLLFDGFSLEFLTRNYDAIIRFISLFDAIEQLGLGVLVRNTAAMPLLSREALEEMKVTIRNSNETTEEIKQHVLVGIDRCASRIGQAGHRAQSHVTYKFS